MDTLATDPVFPRAVRLEAGRAVALARALSDQTRLCLLIDLAAGERRVGELVLRHGVPQPTVSHHVGLLRSLGLVRGRREGKSILYSIVPGDDGGPLFRLPAAGLDVSIRRVRGT